MPWLYSNPQDTTCKLRGVDDEDSTTMPGKGFSKMYWDGSRDRWFCHVSERVEPDSVRLRSLARFETDSLWYTDSFATERSRFLLGLPRFDEQIAQGD